MIKRPNNKKRQQTQISLFLCEGESEYYYFFHLTKQNKEIKTQKANRSNAYQLIQQAQLLCSERDYNKIYCIFDRDEQSNTLQQMKDIDNIIQQSNSKLERVLSNPCFEVWFLFNFIDYTSIYKRCLDVEKKLNDELKKNNMNITYQKTETCMLKMIQITDIKIMSQNSKKSYEKLTHLKICQIDENFTEIFKLYNL